jgi:hypothetical protein
MSERFTLRKSSMKSAVDRRRELKIEFHTTTKNGFFSPSCGFARAGSENFELNLAAIDPASCSSDHLFSKEQAW